MESTFLTSIFRQLFRHRACETLRARSELPFRIRRHPQKVQRRTISSLVDEEDVSKRESNWQQRTLILPENRTEEYKRYPMVTAHQLRSRKERPRRVKMLLRDFIEDSLYNPFYGYFSKHVVIFSPGEPFQFHRMKNEPEFFRQLSERYTSFENALDAKAPDPNRQLWHTPTELFRPYYGEAVARYLVSNYKLTLYPYYDLIIYELGAGNGTLMLNILDYIRDAHPEVYARTQFRVIEISSTLASLQTKNVHSTPSARAHKDKIKIINRSIFSWDTYVPSPCFFLALEVFDNFPHDSIRYEPVTEKALQCTVLIDGRGDFYEFYSHEIDPLASRFLRVRQHACGVPFAHPLGSSRLGRRIRGMLPFAANLTEPEYIPTRLVNFFDILHEYFPAHRLVTSDFDQLPDAIPGINAPVVQTRYERRTVPVSTPLVHQGYFDVIFPTDFAVMEAIYRALTGKFARVLSHEDFLRRWAYVDDTCTASGENPMLSWYKNAKVMLTL